MEWVETAFESWDALFDARHRRLPAIRAIELLDRIAHDPEHMWSIAEPVPVDGRARPMRRTLIEAGRPVSLWIYWMRDDNLGSIIAFFAPVES